MSSNSGKNLQNTFLNNVRKNKISVTIFLVNGVKLQGIVTWFDSFCILLRRASHAQLVYKHAISTIMPAQPVSLYEGEDSEAASFANAENNNGGNHSGGNAPTGNPAPAGNHMPEAGSASE